MGVAEYIHSEGQRIRSSKCRCGMTQMSENYFTDGPAVVITRENPTTLKILTIRYRPLKCTPPVLSGTKEENGEAKLHLISAFSNHWHVVLNN